MAARRKIDIRFHEGGRIDIMANVSKALSIEPGDAIDIHFDMQSREMYLYVKHKANSVAKYCNAVRSTKGTSRNVRVQSLELSSFVNRITGSKESWLYVGEPKFVARLNCNALPIIFLNNQYKNEQS